MTFVPNAPAAAVPRQATLSAADLDVLAAGAAQTGVAAGCLVEANGTTLVLTVSPGVAYYRGARIAFAGGTVAALPDPALPRRALVTVAVGGAVAIAHGAPSLAPLLPDVAALPPNAVVVGAVDVEAGAAAIALGQVLPGKRVPVLDPPGGPMATVALQGAHVVVGNGANQTAELRAALAAARDHATVKTVRVLGTVLIDPTRDTVGDALGTVVYEGCVLEGAGYASVLKARPNTLIDNADFYLVRYRSNATIRNLRFDGNKGAVAAAGWVNHGQFAVSGSFEARAQNATLQNLWIHDVLGVGSESFGVLSQALESGLRVRGCRVWGVDGTGISPSATALGDRSVDVEISGCSCWGNGWSGFSVYGCDDVRLSDCRARDNAHGGFNVEWSGGVDLVGCLAHGNGYGGIVTLGDVTLRAHACRLYANNTVGGSANEVSLQVSTVGATKRVARYVEVRDCAISPPGTRAHLWYSVDDAIADGPTRPTVVVSGPDVAGWKVNNSNGSAHTTVTRAAGRPPTAGAVTSVANGGTLNHGLGVVPRRYGATPTVAGQVVAVTAASASALTFSVLTSAGAAVTAATPVAWWAEA